MAKPLRTDNPAPPSMQFAHFGVLNDGGQSKSSLFTSISINVIVAVVVCILGAAAKKIETQRLKNVTFVDTMKKPPEPIKPKVAPPKILPKPPVVKIEAPKIKIPEVKLPEIPKPMQVKMTQPVPVVIPAPPKLVEPPPAPKVVSLAQARPASVMNNNHPSAVSLGQRDNPIAPSDRPSTTAVNLGNRGMSGMPASNRGLGATAVNLGSGSANSRNMNGRDNAANEVRGVKLGGGEGPMNSRTRVAGPVNLGQNEVPHMPRPAVEEASASHPPKVLFKPKPQYTAEAIKMHVEGVVSVRLQVSSSGSVHVLGVTSDLGYGLGQSAIRAVEGTRFQPATDASGRPVNWEGVVNVAFQLAG